jgi:hypothetical protein
MVGLNISRPVSQPFINFHDPNPRANDFKIRYAFRNSAFYGAYMTDIIKFLQEADSKNVITYLKGHPVLIEKNGSAQEFVKVCNWRGFQNAGLSAFRGRLCHHGPLV